MTIVVSDKSENDDQGRPVYWGTGGSGPLPRFYFPLENIQYIVHLKI